MKRYSRGAIPYMCVHYRCRVNYPRISFKQLSSYLKYMIVPLTWCCALIQHYTCRAMFTSALQSTWCSYRFPRTRTQKSGQTNTHVNQLEKRPSAAVWRGRFTSICYLCQYFQHLAEAGGSLYFNIIMFCFFMFGSASPAPINSRRSVS